LLFSGVNALERMTNMNLTKASFALSLALGLFACAPPAGDETESEGAAAVEGAPPGDEPRLGARSCAVEGERAQLGAFQYKRNGDWTLVLIAGNGSVMMRSTIDFPANQIEDQLMGLGFTKEEGNVLANFRVNEVKDLTTNTSTFTFKLVNASGATIAESVKDYTSADNARQAFTRAHRMFACMAVG
jgi:uncharacterized protein YegP (UPF0339 family)